MEYTEEQSFDQWWLWVLLFGITLIPVYGIIRQIILKQSFGNQPMSNTGLIIFAVCMFSALWFFSHLKLTTKINEQEIRMNFTPFAKKMTKWKDVGKAEVLDYGFVGGWGVRMGTKYGTVYNVKGNMGLALELKNGQKYLIGTQKPEELKTFLEKISR